jgi:hypothetical protein
MIRRINSKPCPVPVIHLKINSRTIEEPRDIANEIGSTLSYNSSSNHFTDRYQRYQTLQEQPPINFASNNQDSYNQPFSFPELRDALRKSHDSATGPDEIHYQMLKLPPASALGTQFQIFNDVWTTGRFAPSWSEATVIPIPKPGKVPTSADNYIPIA